MLLRLSDDRDRDVRGVGGGDRLLDHHGRGAQVEEDGLTVHVQAVGEDRIVDDVGPLGDGDGSVVRAGQPLEQGDGLAIVAGDRPCPQEVGAVVGLGADQRDAGARRERQDTVVLEEHAALGDRLAREAAVGGRERDAGGAVLVAVAERIVEQADAVLQREHAAAREVDRRADRIGGDLDAAFRPRQAALGKARKVGEVVLADHVHVDAGDEGESGRALAVAEPVGGEFHDAGVVGDHEPVEPRTSAQPAVDQARRARASGACSAR